MNIIKVSFLIALFNFVLIGMIVLVFKKPVEMVPVFIQPDPIVTAIPSITTVIPTTRTVFPNTVIVAKPTTDNRCIIVVDGSRYNITQYRYLHSGGDIFQCGTDMSNVFHNRHPNSFLNRMSQYKI